MNWSALKRLNCVSSIWKITFPELQLQSVQENIDGKALWQAEKLSLDECKVVFPIGGRDLSLPEFHGRFSRHISEMNCRVDQQETGRFIKQNEKSLHLQRACLLKGGVLSDLGWGCFHGPRISLDMWFRKCIPGVSQVTCQSLILKHHLFACV